MGVPLWAGAAVLDDLGVWRCELEAAHLGDLVAYQIYRGYLWVETGHRFVKKRRTYV